MFVAHTLLAHTLFALAFLSVAHAMDSKPYEPEHHQPAPHQPPPHQPPPHQPPFHQQNILVTNDDGWAANKLREQKKVLENAGHKVLLCAPANDESGTGSAEAPPAILTKPCEFDTCPIGSPAVGFNKSDPSLNYVNSFPTTVTDVALNTLSKKFFHGHFPDIVLAGTNDGLNAGITTLISGTIAAACEASMEGVPSIAYSADAGVQVTQDGYLNASNNAPAAVYAELSLKVFKTLIQEGKPYLDRNISINVNYPRATGRCAKPEAYTFILTRIMPNPNVTDVVTCGSNHLPLEAQVLANTTTCQATISVFNATNRGDVDARAQEVVQKKLGSILSCLPHH